MKIAVIGTGYVGLVTGTCFADMGHDVMCVDLDQAKIQSLNEGKIPIYEPGLDHLVARNRRDGRLAFTTDLPSAVKGRQAVFIAVGTPPGEDGRADLQYVSAAAKSIGRAMDGYTVVINKSTVPVGTGDKVRAILGDFAKVPFDVVSNPEFLKEGTAVDDFMKPDRVVIGCDAPRAKAVMEDLYAPFLRNNHPILFMDVRSAELAKYAANAMLALRISFMNEMANLCDSLGADVNMVRRGIGSDRRIGPAFLYPGIGYGGSCFPKDVKALIQTAAEAGRPSAILKAVEAVNEHQKRILLERIFHRFGANLKGHHFAFWGLSFKPETDDIREAPSLVMLEALRDAGATVSATDPEAMDAVKRVLGDRVTLVKDAYECLKGADALILCTEWNEYRNPDFEKIASILKQPVIFDGRNLWRERPETAAFEYTCIGSNRAKG